MKRTVTLEIAGTKFKLVTDTDEAHLQALATLVNERVAQLGNAARHASSGQLLALAALGLADDLRSAEAKVDEVARLTRGVVENAIARIDQRLAADAAGAPSDAR